MSTEGITLYFTEGSSDKEYRAQLEDTGNGWVVNFQFGRRGATLKHGTKTDTPILYGKAKPIYDKLVAEKMAKGYTPAESGAAFAKTDKAGLVSGILPQLLNAVPREHAESLLTNPDWVMQEKFDGERRLVRVSADGSIEGINRKGLVMPLPQGLVDHLKQTAAHGAQVIDGEQIGEFFVAFDALEIDGQGVRALGFAQRYEALERRFSTLAPQGNFAVALAYRNTKSKEAHFPHLEANGREGVVFKRADAPYAVGRPNSGGDALKFKFVNTATLIVTAGRDGKRSVGLALLDASGAPVEVGNVTIPANHNIPAPDALAEVQYLYAYPNGSLYQPVYRGERNDIERGACTLDQLAYKTTPEAGERRGVRP